MLSVQKIFNFILRLVADERLILINNIRSIDNNILNLNDSGILEVLLFGNSSFNNTKNTYILNTTIEYIVSSKKFEVPLFHSSWHSCMAVLFTSYCFYSFFFLFLSFVSFTVPFPIIVDLVLHFFIMQLLNLIFGKAIVFYPFCF